MHRRKLSKTAITLIVIGIVVFFALLFIIGSRIDQHITEPEARKQTEVKARAESSIEINGSLYQPKKQLTTILLMGVDKSTEAEQDAVGFRSGGQSDFLRLVIVDSRNNQIRQIQIDRDTIAPVTVLSILGKKTGVRNTQICLSHSFGDGGELSAQLTCEAVSSLLLGIPIDYYICMYLDGIASLNDFVGGITVTLEDDFSHIDPVMTKGATVTLHGEQAEIYVRSRMSVGDGTNEARMKRQQSYLEQLMEVLKQKLSQNKEVAGKAFDIMTPYMTTNLSKGRLMNIVWASKDYPSHFDRLAGSYTIGSDGFKEFHANEKQLEQLVLNAFYDKVESVE